MAKCLSINIYANRRRRRSITKCLQHTSYRVRFKLLLTIWIYLFIVFLYIFFFLYFSLGIAPGRKFYTTTALSGCRLWAHVSTRRAIGYGQDGKGRKKPEKQIKTRPEAVCVNAVWTGGYRRPAVLPGEIRPQRACGRAPITGRPWATMGKKTTIETGRKKSRGMTGAAVAVNRSGAVVALSRAPGRQGGFRSKRWMPAEIINGRTKRTIRYGVMHSFCRSVFGNIFHIVQRDWNVRSENTTVEKLTVK